MARRISAFLVGLLLVTAGAGAQERFGSLAGTVTDTTKAAVPGATVTATNKETGASASRSAASDGSYRVTRSRPGPLLGHDRAPVAFRKLQVDDAIVLLGRTIGRRCRARPGVLTEVVSVTGEATRQLDLIERDARAQRDRRGVRPAAEGPQLPEHRDGRARRELRRGRRRLPGERREQRRERVHRGRRRHQQLDLRQLAAEHRVRVPAGSAGQDRRHRRRIRRRARRRDQRGDQVRRQHLHR